MSTISTRRSGSSSETSNSCKTTRGGHVMHPPREEKLCCETSSYMVAKGNVFVIRVGSLARSSRILCSISSGLFE